MQKTICLLPGDGIGPEIVAEAVKVLRAVEKKFGHSFTMTEALLGGAAIDAVGVPQTLMLSLFLFRLPLIAVAIAYYSETSTISEMLVALKGLHFPDLVLLQLDITIKYIDVFGKQLMDLLKGIEARSFGGNHRFRIGSNIWGILYLKAIRYGEELTQAMEARCFVGEYVKSSQSFTWKDWLALISLVAVILGQILLGG